MRPSRLPVRIGSSRHDARSTTDRYGEGFEIGHGMVRTRPSASPCPSLLENATNSGRMEVAVCNMRVGRVDPIHTDSALQLRSGQLAGILDG